MFIRLQSLVDGTVRKLSGFVHPNTLKDVYVNVEPESFNRSARINARVEVSCDESEEGLEKAGKLLTELSKEVERRIKSKSYKP